MRSESGSSSSGLWSAESAASAALRAMTQRVVAHVTLAGAAQVLASSLADLFEVPLALLSSDGSAWRLEAHAFPRASGVSEETRFTEIQRAPVPGEQLHQDAGAPWTAIALDSAGSREWAILLPGSSAIWAARPGFDEVVAAVGWSLAQVSNQERAHTDRRFHRRLYGLTRRLASSTETLDISSILLRAVASLVEAEIGAVAVFSEVEGVLAITSTVGYPSSVVEHLRIYPGEGLLGRVYESGRPLLGDSAGSTPLRLRYRTTSYMLLPVVSGKTCFAVVALTDRRNGQPFNDDDFAAARIMVSAAVPAFSRERFRTGLVALSRVATADVVTGLFNRRYFESRLEAEIERARRQGQDLALLLIDIDDFKHVNDTRGHLEGDRILREVADLLREGVRIFDVCARYGGEEFVIVMPAASETVAQQVAERIRSQIERRFRDESPSVTVSIGVAMLGNQMTPNEFVDLADRRLIEAKRAGKNLVRSGAPLTLRLTE